MVVAALMFALLGLLIKSIPAGLSSAEVVFLRNLMTLCIIAPFFFVSSNKFPDAHSYKLYILKVLSGLMAMYCYYYALQTLPLSLAVLLNNTAPLFIPIVMMFMMKKFCGKRVAFYVLGGFVGVLLILVDAEMMAANVSVLVGLLAGFFLAVSHVSVSAIGRKGSPLNIMFYFMLSTTLVSFAVLRLDCTLPSSEQAVFLFAAGLVTALGGWASAKAFLIGMPNKLGPLNYLTVPFAFALGIIFLEESMSAFFVIGLLLVLIFSMLNLLDTKARGENYD